MHQVENFVEAPSFVLSLFYTMPYKLSHYTYTLYRLHNNLCIPCNCTNKVDCETRQKLVIEPWTLTGGKSMDMKMRKVALRAGEK
jgi:hypothetical protein